MSSCRHKGKLWGSPEGKRCVGCNALIWPKVVAVALPRWVAGDGGEVAAGGGERLPGPYPVVGAAR